jgi:hypothetical protein
MQIIMPRWNKIESPAFQWVPGFERIISSYNLPEFRGKSIYITSDYSGIPNQSKYFTISILYLDIDASKNWEMRRKKIRELFLPDGRRMSFKGMNDKQKQSALIPFLEATNEISGILVSVAIHKEALNVSCDPKLFDMIQNANMLKGIWQYKAYENAMRISHFVSLLVGGLSRPDQDIYWISDDDRIFDNAGKTEDVKKMVSAFTSKYVKHNLGELGIGTTKLDEGDLLEEDLAAIPDLAAGAICEIITKMSDDSGGRIPRVIGIPFSEQFSMKTNIIARWLFSKSIQLKNIVILIEPDTNKMTRISKFDLEDAPGLLY